MHIALVSRFARVGDDGGDEEDGEEDGEEEIRRRLFGSKIKYS